MKRYAVLAGTIAQTLVFVVLLTVIQPPVSVYITTAVIAGVVTGALSDRFESEYIDAGKAGIFGTLLSLAIFISEVWWNNALLPPVFRIDITFITFMYGLGVAIFLLPMVVLLSAGTGHVTAIALDN